MQASLSPPIAPPIKKQRSSNTPDSDRISLEANDAIARRRAELRRLQQIRTERTASGTEVTATEGLLARARNQLHVPPPTMVPGTGSALRGGGRPAPPPPAMPNPSGAARVRHSDIFPSALKVAQEQIPARAAAPPGPPPPGGPPRGPPPPSGPPGGPPSGPPPVARRLDVSFADTPKPSDRRSKSAPRSRPPLPPTTPHAAVEAPEPRDYVNRPPPVTPGAPPPPPSHALNAGRTPGPPKVAFETTDDAGRTPFPVVKGTPFPVKGTPFPVKGTPFPVKGSAMPSPTDPAPTPLPTKTQEMPPTTGRRDLLRNMREHADTPPAKEVPSPPFSGIKSPLSPELRMHQELLKTQQDKRDALEQLARMGKEMVKLREESASAQKLEAVIQMAEAEGETVALDWARQHVREKQVGFLSPMANLLATPASPRNLSQAMTPLSMSRNTGSIRKRMSTPHPKHNLQDVGEDVDTEFLKEVAKCAVFEFEVKDLASYVIRRPFGLAAERDLWFSAGQRNAKMYERSADVHKASTMEVVAIIEADGSVLAVYGEAMVRHKKGPNGEWKDYGNMDERDKSLGSVMFIDGEANEKEYSLDDVFEGAVAARHHYCSSLVVAAAALRLQKDSQPPALVSEQPPPTFQPMQLEQAPKVETNEICVGTEDLPFPPAPNPGAKAALPNGAQKAPEKKAKSASKPPPPPTEDVADVLSVIFSLFFGNLFWIIWTALVRIPLKIFATTLYMLIGGMILSVVWVYLADDNGASAMGAVMGSMYNRPGIV
jgi:hypothetical protein